MEFTQIQLVVLLAFLLMTVIFVFFIVSIVRYQRKYIRIQKELTKAEVDTLEKERQRIANDLHDSLGPLLSAVKLQINSLDTQLPDDLELIDKASVYIDSIMTSIRAVSNSLSPKLLMRKGLPSAIEDLVINTRAVFHIAVNYDPIAIPRLADDDELHIYRILQELIHNTVKHAACTQMVIKLYEEKQMLILITADDGKGFDVTARKEAGTGLGLRNIETRTDILNGTLDVESKPGEGTKYIFEFPLKPLAP